MTRQAFELQIVNWRVVVFYDADGDDAGLIAKALRGAGCAEANMERAIAGIGSKTKNNGFTYSNLDNRTSVMVIGKTTSAEEFANTYNHEKGHLLRHISKTYDIDPYGEEEQYLAGEISSKMFAVAKRYMCDECRRKTSTAHTFFKVFMR